MKAMIFAAGLGTRLGTLTEHKPKALVEVNGKPMLEHVVDYLKSYCITNIIINVHHFADMIVDFVALKNNFDINIAFSYESIDLLDTGGGLVEASWFFDKKEPFVVHNVDVLSKTNLQEVIFQHKKQKTLATLVVKKRDTARYILIDSAGELCGWRNKKTGEEIIVRESETLFEAAYSGIQVVDPKIFSINNMHGKFSITPMYLELAKKHRISTYLDKDLWFDLGKVESIAEAERVFFNK